MLTRASRHLSKQTSPQMFFVFRGFFARLGTAARHAWHVGPKIRDPQKPWTTKVITNMFRYLKWRVSKSPYFWLFWRWVFPEPYPYSLGEVLGRIPPLEVPNEMFGEGVWLPNNFRVYLGPTRWSPYDRGRGAPPSAYISLYPSSLPYLNHHDSRWGLNPVEKILVKHAMFTHLVGGFNQPIWKICESQIGSFPQIGVKIKK